MKNIRIFYLKIFNFLEEKFSVYWNRCDFLMKKLFRRYLFFVLLDVLGKN